MDQYEYDVVVGSGAAGTEVRGVWAAGNVADVGAQVMGAAAAGSVSGDATTLDPFRADLREGVA